jgi:ADP-ribose pyrophosphatase
MSYIKKVTENKVSRWLTIVEKEVRFPHSSIDETYYSVKVADYVAALIITKDEQILLVKQYRPVVDGYTYELPSGMVDPEEEPESAVIREVYEETGYSCHLDNVVLLGKLVPDTGRLENTLWAYYIESADKPLEGWNTEEGVEPILVSKEKFQELSNTGLFNHALHLAIVGLAYSKGCFSF